MAMDLSAYPEEQILRALEKCRKELKSKLTVQSIISRIDDGRPGHEEAWAMIPKNESSSVVWTQEMSEAYGIACPLINMGDMVQARMAFIEAYKDRCDRARNDRIVVQWFPSLGHDPQGREHVLMEAVEKGRLSASHVAGLLPYRDGSDLPKELIGLGKNSKSGLKKLSIISPGKSNKDVA